MTTSPFEILGVPAGADDEQIRRAYLGKVRQHPPERDPQAFQVIQAAYERIKDVRARLEDELFHVAELDTIRAALPTTAKRPTLAQFRALLKACSRDGG